MISLCRRNPGYALFVLVNAEHKVLRLRLSGEETRTWTILSRHITRFTARKIVSVYLRKYRGFPVRPRSRSFLAHSLHMRPHVYVHAYAHVCVSMCTLQWRECHGKAKNTFRINCRAGIPRRCVEQNATTLCSTYKRQENGKGRLVGRSVGWLLAWLVGRSVGRSGRRDARGYTRLVKMQTSRFGVDAGRERSRAGRCAIRCCRFA